jgi:DNA-binding response OmpR family regulator
MAMTNIALSGDVVLLVEELPLTTPDLQETLECAGADVLRADLSEALELAQQRSLSAAVIDCHPTSRDRRALLRRLRQRQVPFLFYSLEPPANVTTERGVPFIAKPCSSEKIIAAVRFVLGR